MDSKKFKLLKFSPGKNNAKLRKLEKKTKKKIWSISGLSGHTCPFAKQCKSQAIETPQGMRIQDGPDTVFRCFSASQEVLLPAVYAQRKHNTDLLNKRLSAGELSIEDAAELIHRSIPKNAEIVRIHVGGDFNTQAHFDAWLKAIRMNPSKEFYAYTKAIPFLLKRQNEIPDNFSITCSWGGHKDNLIIEHNLKCATVVKSNYEARKLGLKVDTNDYKALCGNESFALVIHGCQPKGSDYAKRWEQIRRSRIKSKR